jgi:ribosomal protein L11 methylase PrmA
MILELLVIIICLIVLYQLSQGAIYLPTKKPAIEKIIEFAGIRPGMRVLDLGSGDGRVVIALAQAGAQAYGFEINPILVVWSNYKIRKSGLANRATVLRKNFWNESFAEYELVVIFGMSHIMDKLEQKLRTELKPGTLVISNIFQFPNWAAIAEEEGVRVYKA